MSVMAVSCYCSHLLLLDSNITIPALSDESILSAKPKHEANNDEPTILLACSQHVALGALDDYTNPPHIPRGIGKKILISPTYMGNLSFKVPYKSPYNFAFAQGPPPRGKPMIGALPFYCFRRDNFLFV